MHIKIFYTSKKNMGAFPRLPIKNNKVFAREKELLI